MTLDISGDYTIFDGGETVTVRQIRPDGATSVTVDNAVPGLVSNTRLGASGIDIQGDEKAYSLNATQCGPRGINIDDIVVDSAGVSWRVVQSTLATIDTRWRVVCRRQV